MAPAHAIYADEMTNLMHGYPLWEPECRPEVAIADVGYMRNGRFCRLFNASLPPGHPLNEFGVPEGYEPLDLDERAMVERRLPPGPMSSRSIINHGVTSDISGSILQAGLGFQFSCARDRGAILIINSEARRKDSEQRGAFKRYMLRHYKSWHTFANAEPRSRDISVSDLVFVTGRDNTADWAVAAFSERSTTGGVHFQASFPTLAGIDFSIWGSWSGITSLHSNCGPQIFRRNASEVVTASGGQTGHACAADLGDYDQCIFIRGLRVMDRTSQVRQKIGIKVSGSSQGLELLQQPWMSRSSSGDSSRTIKGGSNTSGGSWGKQKIQSADNSALDKKDGSNDVRVVSNGVEICAPVELLLAYILQRNPEASVALAHDDDMAAIIEKNDSLDFGLLLSKVCPPVVVDSEGVGTVSFDVSNVPPPSDQGKDGLQSGVFRKPEQVADKPVLRRELSPQRGRQPARANGGTAKPDSAAYDEQQERISAKINIVQARLAELQGKISLISKNGRLAERRTTLRAELDVLRDRQLASEAAREAMTAELKRAQEELRVKIKDLQGMAKKLPAKTIDELESKRRTLDRKVEAGNMGHSEEKKIVGQINSLKRSHTAVEVYQTMQADVETDREKAERLRRELDSQPKDLSGRFDEVRAELDGLQREREQTFANRAQLFRERDELRKELSGLHEERRQSAEQFRERRKEFWVQLTEDRALEAERVRMEQSALEGQRRGEARERLLEKARVPAYGAEIRDCRSLLEYFGGRADSHAAGSPTVAAEAAAAAEAPARVSSGENHPGPGWVPLKKKTDEEAFFVGGKCKAKKGQRRGTSAAAAAASKISIPLGIIHLLSSLAVAPPTTTAEIPAAIEEIKRKIGWFEANEPTATEENVARVEAELSRIGHATHTMGRSVTA